MSCPDLATESPILVVCQTGNPLRPSDLELVNLTSARSVMVLPPLVPDPTSRSSSRPGRPRPRRDCHRVPHPREIPPTTQLRRRAQPAEEHSADSDRGRPHHRPRRGLIQRRTAGILPGCQPNGLSVRLGFGPHSVTVRYRVRRERGRCHAPLPAGLGTARRGRVRRPRRSA